MFGALHAPGWRWGSVPGTQPGDPSAAAAIALPPQEHRDSPEVLEQIYCCNPILRYTSGPLYAPLLPFPYGSLDQSGEGRWGAQSWVLHSRLVALMAGLGALRGRRALDWGLAGPGCEDSAQLLAGGPGEDHGAVNPHPIPQPLAPAAIPRCATRL